MSGRSEPSYYDYTKRVAVASIQRLRSSGAINDDEALDILTGTSEGPSIAEAIEKARDVTEKRLHRSLATYEKGFKRIERYFPGRSLVSIVGQDIEDAIEKVYDEAALRPQTKHGHGAVENFLHAFGKVFEVGRIPSPIESSMWPPRPDNDRQALSSPALAGISEAVDTVSNDPELDELLIAVLLETAARRGALVGLRLGDLKPGLGYAELARKGQVSYKVPLSQELQRRIRDLAIDRKAEADNPEEPAFRTRSGANLYGNYLYELFKRIRGVVGEEVPKNITPHWMRYTTLWLVERRFGASVAQAYAGHMPAERTDRVSHRASIGIYTRPTIGELIMAHDAIFSTSPAAPQFPSPRQLRRPPVLRVVH